MYIAQEKRNKLNPLIDSLVDVFRQLQADDPDNDFEENLNYVITTLLVQVYNKTSYRDIHDVVGALECCKLEFHRRRGAVVGNQQAFENGDVFDGVSAEKYLLDKIK